jgi:hypothetical protein
MASGSVLALLKALVGNNNALPVPYSADDVTSLVTALSASLQHQPVRKAFAGCESAVAKALLAVACTAESIDAAVKVAEGLPALVPYAPETKEMCSSIQVAALLQCSDDPDLYRRTLEQDGRDLTALLAEPMDSELDREALVKFAQNMVDDEINVAPALRALLNMGLQGPGIEGPATMDLMARITIMQKTIKPSKTDKPCATLIDCFEPALEVRAICCVFLLIACMHQSRSNQLDAGGRG